MRGVAVLMVLIWTSRGLRHQSTSSWLRTSFPVSSPSPRQAFAAFLLAPNPATHFDRGIATSQRLARGAPSHLARAARMQMNAQLYDPAQRDIQYGDPLNAAQYLIDLHDTNATFDFCGGMMFQLVLTDKLRSELLKTSQSDGRQPIVFDKSLDLMAMTPDYKKSAHADNIQFFHGREIRQVPDAAGGMGFILQLSSPENDLEGWTSPEVDGYDGWDHDSRRTWRTADRHESEGFDLFKSRFGEAAFSLHHRFYLHYDSANKLWLSAEDGCEGTPANPGSGPQEWLNKVIFR